jgi:hydroxypyruvate isomerase
MVDLTANLTMLYPEHAFFERFERAADAGFTAVEFFFPYGLDHARLRHEIERNGLELTLFNLPLGDWDAGERGFVAQSSRRSDFASGVHAAVESASLLSPTIVNTPSGPAVDDVESFETLVDNLRLAARSLAAIGVGLVIEPINTIDVPGAFVSTVARARTVIEEVDEPNLGIQYDLYHSIRAGEDPAAVLRANLDVIRHIQIADVPGRHQPGTGDVDFTEIFSIIDASDYAGRVSLEYHPDGPTDGSFAGIRALGLLPSAPAHTTIL